MLKLSEKNPGAAPGLEHDEIEPAAQRDRADQRHLHRL